VSIGTVLVTANRARVCRIALALFAVALAGFGRINSAGPGYPVAFFVGLFYFAAVTALSTHLQEHLSDTVRGRVMALWIMAFGGTVPLGVLAGGWLARRTTIGTVLLLGAAVAGLLALFTRVGRGPQPPAPLPAD
jgi:sugar phosphate permease